MSWVQAWAPLATALALLMVPGLAVAACLRFRNLSAVALAPAFSCGIIGVFGIVLNWIHVPWSLWSYLGSTALTTAAAALLSRRFRPDREPATRLNAVVPLLALLLALGLAGRRLTSLLGSPTNIAQVFDNVFHLNAIRFIVESGNASSLTLASFQGFSGLQALYPATWHSAAALVMELTGCGPQVAENSVNVIAAAVVWPLSSIFFSFVLFRRRPVAVLAAGVFSVVQVAFPYLLLVWGPLFPNLLSISLLPAVLAVIVHLARRMKVSMKGTGRWWAALLVSLAGCVTAHMSAINTILAMATPLIIAVWFRRLNRWSSTPRGERRTAPWPLLLFGLIFVVGAVVSWTKVRPVPYDNWGPTVTAGAAVGEVITNSPMQTGIALVVSVFCITGVVCAFLRKEHRWLVASYALIGALYVTDAAGAKGFWRDLATGTWYQDTYRLAALLPVVATPLAAYGCAITFSGLRRWFRQAQTRWQLSRPVLITLCVLLGAMATALAYLGPVRGYVAASKSVYSLQGDSPILGTGELSLIERLPSHVPAGVKVADNPWNGSSLAFAFGSTSTLTPHLFAAPDPEAAFISQRLKFEPSSPAMCKALKDENVDYVLDFGHYYMLNLPSTGDYPGVTDVGGTPGLTLVDSQGTDAALYRIDSCPDLRG